MTPEQEAHLGRIKADFARLVDSKYRRGAAEHGGQLLDLPAVRILEQALDEAVDQLVYLLSLKEKLFQERTDAAA